MLSKNRIKFVKSLYLKKYRDELNLFLVEGEKIARELILLKPEFIEAIYATDEFVIESNNPFNIERITQKELNQLSLLKSPNKVLAICKKFRQEDKGGEFYIALDDIQDPGNLGTIIRVADWFGVKNIVCSVNTADFYNPKVIQATMGSLFRVNVFYQELNSFIKSKGLPVFGAFLEGESIYKMNLSPKGILVLGNEGSGISSELAQLIKQKITIPRFGNAESLNVSVATGIVLSEFFRKIKPYY